MTEFLSFEVATVQDLGKKINENIKYFPSKTILLLSGEMGSGKTEFVKTLNKTLNKTEIGNSPTFTFHQHYPGKIPIEHWDLFRIESVDSLESVGFWDQFTSSENKIICVEWVEKIDSNQLPMDWNLIYIKITVKGEARRFAFLSGR